MISLIPRPVRTLTLLLGLVFLSGCGEDLRPKIAELEAQLAKEKESLAETSGKLANERADFAASKAAFAKEKDSLAATVEELRIALGATSSELEKQKLVLSASLNDLAKVKTKLDEAESELAREKFSTGIKLAALERAEAEKKAAAERVASLSVQLGLTMRSGDTKPIANTKVYLVKSQFSEITAGMERIDNYGKPFNFTSLFDAVGRAAAGGAAATLFSNLYREALSYIKKERVAEVDSDFSGVANFEEIPRGNYYVICITPLGGGAVLQKEVMISAPKSKIALSNSDVLN